VQAGVTAIALDLASPTAGGAGMTVDEVTSGERTLTFTHAAGRLQIALAAAPAAGSIQSFTVMYHGRPGDGLNITKNRYGDRTVFADNFPDRARGWLPTVDHPSDKATCDFVVDAPARDQVVANGRLVEETDLAGDRRRTHWREAEPIATYLMVIGVARFAVQYVDEAGGVPIETWVYPQDRDAGFFDFARTRRVLEFFSDRVGPYDYEKLANVESTTRYGGMENASNIFFTERAVTGTRRVESTVVHEVAHQWFGDSVTESDWNHVWLSEGFATYFTHLFDEWAYGRDRLVAGMTRDRDIVLAFAAGNPDLRVVDDRVPIRQVLSPYTYQKGGWVLHMLRRRIGDEAFWEGIRTYHRTYRNGNALSEDFARVMSEASGQDLTGFFTQWLYEPGQPDLDVTWRYDAARKAIALRVEQRHPGPAFAFELDVGVAPAEGAPPRSETVKVTERVQSFTMAADTEPAALSLDPDVWLLYQGRVTRK
jgi:aminopeptidase N